MILIGLGGNLDSSRYGPPRRTLEAALDHLTADGIRVVRRSRFWRSAPVPPSNQPWFVNAVAVVETSLGPRPLLEALLALERAFGRRRTVPNAARVLDLDLLAYAERVSAPEAIPVLPHPRLAERAFVLHPLADVAPDWRHPVSGKSVAALIAALPAEARAEPLAEA